MFQEVILYVAYGVRHVYCGKYWFTYSDYDDRKLQFQRAGRLIFGKVLGITECMSCLSLCSSSIFCPCEVCFVTAL